MANVWYPVVAGGGAGGKSGGGGGSGGYKTNAAYDYTVTVGPYTVTVGDGASTSGGNGGCSRTPDPTMTRAVRTIERPVSVPTRSVSVTPFHSLGSLLRVATMTARSVRD